jgi:hypothetical protein
MDFAGILRAYLKLKATDVAVLSAVPDCGSEQVHVAQEFTSNGTAVRIAALVSLVDG